MNCCGRREALAGSGVAVAGVLLTGCGSGDGAGTADTLADAAATAADEAVSRLVSAADVPVGGGTVVERARVVVTQPSEGEFRAFSAVCPHQGCLVTDVDDGAIVCPCHGSRFDISSGEVLAGPARTGLEERAVTLDGDGISVG
jgi:nitrite reductase/ring-hydroxylating ferredoxin subunit